MAPWTLVWRLVLTNVVIQLTRASPYLYDGLFLLEGHYFCKEHEQIFSSKSISMLACLAACSSNPACGGVTYRGADGECSGCTLLVHKSSMGTGNEDILYWFKILVPRQPTSECKDVLNLDPQAELAVYRIGPTTDGMFVNALCDMTFNGGGWTESNIMEPDHADCTDVQTDLDPCWSQAHIVGFLNEGLTYTVQFNIPISQVFQNHLRFDQVFTTDWDAYENGFGDVMSGHWLGLATLHNLTRDAGMDVAMVFVDLSFTAGIQIYEDFQVGAGPRYTMNMGQLLYRNDTRFTDSGSALSDSNLCAFSTYDNDMDGNDSVNCGEVMRGGFWYPPDCGDLNPNGRPSLAGIPNTLFNYAFNEFNSILRTRMMIRSRN